MAIEPNTKADLEKLGNGLHKLGQEDPSFHHQRDEENNQTARPPARPTPPPPPPTLFDPPFTVAGSARRGEGEGGSPDRS